MRHWMPVVTLALVACGGGAPPPAAAPTTGAPPTKPAAGGHAEDAHALVTLTDACLFGGVWRDALGEKPSVDHCAELLQRAYGTVDEKRLLRVKALERAEVADLGAKVQQLAGGSGASVAKQLFDAVVDAQRETMLARRAADRIKLDVLGEREPTKRMPDEAAAVATLGQSGAMRKLYALKLGDAGLEAEAHAAAVLCAMDRMRDARDLPKHMKVYAVGGAYSMLFGVEPPQAPADVAKPLKAGAWLAYLTATAKAAGHPVPAEARYLGQQELVAWGGVLEGLADKLRAVAPLPEGDTKRVAAGAATRLDAEYKASQNVLRLAEAVRSEPKGQALALVVRAASCWLGGLWADAVGDAEGARALGIEARCHEVARTAYDDPEVAFGSYDPLRWADPKTTDELARKVAALAEADPLDKPRKKQIAALLSAVAATARENLRARHVADVVKSNVEEEPSAEGRAQDKRAAAGVLEAHTGLWTLLDLDAGALTADARALGLLFALDRVEIARGLPPHLKVHVMGATVAKLFGVGAPSVPEDNAAPLPMGTWLAWLEGAAKGAAHAVPPELKDVSDREPVAWTSVLEGFADRLRAVKEKDLTPPLGDVLRATETRVDTEYSGARNAALRHGK